MHLIFVRHGDPDYVNDTVTEKGKREVELLASRIASWNVTDFYVSPLGRAQATLKPALQLTGRTCETLPWLQEFYHKIPDYKNGGQKGCWDFLPRDLYEEKKFFSREQWFNTKAMKKGGIESKFREVTSGFDTILERYGYKRMSQKEAIYKCTPHLTEEEAKIDTHLLPEQKNLDDRNIVFVCHLGVMFAILSHLTGISPVLLWQGFFVAPTSVTVVGAEERIPGEVAFRIQTLGDVTHLTQNGENVSASGFFGNFTKF